MNEPKFKTDGLLLKGLLALSITAVPMVSVWAGVNNAGTPMTMSKPTISAVATAAQRAQATTNTVKGVVKDTHGEPLIGVSVLVKGTGKGAVTNIDGEYTIQADAASPTLVFSYVGYQTQEVAVGNRRVVDVTMQDDSKVLGEVVVTAMGIMRKEKSLTYSTQKVKAEDLVKVQDPNVANTLEGKVSGVTITPSAGGAGGASKIILRGNKSILGNSAILIVVDGVPMLNNTRGQIGSGSNVTYSGVGEGSDPLSMINPDDIESINVLKGANASALYGSVAANGVVMITTKKGKEGKMAVSVASNVTFDTPLLTPEIQNTYGAGYKQGSALAADGWGGKIADLPEADRLLKYKPDTKIFPGYENVAHLRNYAKDDVAEFFRTGITTNNSVSVSGGTEKVQTYFSIGNSHANGMIRNNAYNRNTMAFRQNYKLFEKLNIEVSANFVSTKTTNRPGGGTVFNPIYHTYVTPRNIDMDYYRDNYVHDRGSWISKQSYYEADKDVSGVYKRNVHDVKLEGPMQNWAYMEHSQNNPYWLVNMHSSVQRENRFTGMMMAKYEIIKGLDFQARFNYILTNFNSEGKRHATNFTPQGVDPFGIYSLGWEKTQEFYTDYLLSYNKELTPDWSLSATAGYVGHMVHGENQSKYTAATYVHGMQDKPSTEVNFFDSRAGGSGSLSRNLSSNWDRAALVTAQVGWKDMVYVDGSYRVDWYRAFRQFRNRGTADHYGYFSVGANAIVNQLVKLPEWISYLKYRASYSEVGNSIPNIVFATGVRDLEKGSTSVSSFAKFENPVPEKTKSFETGIESSFFGSKLDFDFTFYNTVSDNLYMIASNAAGKRVPVNSGKVRNRGFETTVAYNFKFVKDFTWRTSANFSFNDNTILNVATNPDGSDALVYNDIAGVRVNYLKGGRIGDMYVTDFRRKADGTFEVEEGDGLLRETQSNKLYKKYVGNMNSKIQLGWSNTINYKDFQLFFLINGRVGGKVISLTEAYLDYLGLSKRTEEARLNAERNNLRTSDGQLAMYLPDGSNRLVGVEEYYRSIGDNKNPSEYIYNATNFRLRELSLGYTFRNLFGQGRNLNLSFIGRNLFFIYKDAPVDPDVSLSTGNGMGAFEAFNMPSSRSYGFSLKLNL